MGVPALFRWLSRKYPKIVKSVIEDGKGLEAPNNPNGSECDALWLDMNGIVHPCTHPEGKKAPETEQDMMIEIFKYTERVVNMAKPRKLIFMAIDGVAPRAKMNQQRSRRFRAAQEARTKEEERIKAIAEWEAMGRPMTDSFKQEKAWDSNAITPGTPFMDLLAASLRYWVAKKMNTDPAWRNVQVIISDASVPGEGEHKIMDYIRRLRSHPEHDPNTRHVIYGLDADLIMLSLATHEPYFKVLREDVFFQGNKPRGCHNCGLPGHHSSMCTNPKKPKEDSIPTEEKPFIFLDVATLREYLEIELNLPGLTFPFDLERAIDDWVFLIFFVGNDFLPHLPSLEIREGAIDTLLTIWRAEITSRMGGYLTEHGSVHLDRLQLIMDGLASREDDIFRKRQEAEERQAIRDAARLNQNSNNSHSFSENTGAMSNFNGAQPEKKRRTGPESYEDVMNITSKYLAQKTGQKTGQSTSGPSGLPAKPSEETLKVSEDLKRAQVTQANLSAAERLKAELMMETEEEDPKVETEAVTAHESPRGMKRKAEEDADMTEAESNIAKGQSELDLAIADAIESSDSDVEEDMEGTSVTVSGGAIPKPLKLLGNNMAEQEDTVKLWEPGYRERYYRQKFGVELTDTEFRSALVKSYVEGLCWVLKYYYQGCPSWNWYFPQHFAPFAADFTDLAALKIDFEIGTPFRPYEQLMAVFPADSRHHIPESLNKFMVEDDSPIIDFYPSHFHIDMNGKKMLWQGVALLPFIDQDRLLSTIRPVEESLADDEKRRNAPGRNAIFVHEAHHLGSQIAALYQGRPSNKPLNIDWKKSNRILGSITADPECVPGSTYFSPLNIEDQTDIDNDASLAAAFDFPSQRVPHRSVLLPNAKPERGALNAHDAEIVRRGGVSDHRPQGDGFHATRRDIDGVGVRRASDRPYSGSGQRSSYQNQTPSQSTNYGSAQHQNYSLPSKQLNAQYNTPPSYSNGSNYSAGGYPYQSNGYQYPSYPQQQQQQHSMYQPPPSSHPVYQPPSQVNNNPYANYGQAPAVLPPVYQPPSNQTFNNGSAYLRNLPPHLQHLNRQQTQPSTLPSFLPSQQNMSQQNGNYVYRR